MQEIWVDPGPEIAVLRGRVPNTTDQRSDTIQPNSVTSLRLYAQSHPPTHPVELLCCVATSAAPQDMRGGPYRLIKSLRLWRAHCGDEGARSIAEVLRLGGAEVQLEYVELFDDNIGPTG